MTDIKLYAWIFLSISKQHATLYDVLYAADVINRMEPSLNMLHCTEPNLNELQKSFGWLIAQGLIKRNEKRYLLTEAGVTLSKSISRENISSIWNAVAEIFSQLPEIDFHVDEIVEKDYVAANRTTKKLNKEIMRRLIEEN